MREKLNGRIIPWGKTNINDQEDEVVKVNFISPSSKDLLQIIENSKHLLRTEIIALKRQGLSSSRDFETVDLMLAKNQNLNYNEFKELGLNAPECVQRFFTAQYFLMFPKDRLGAIASEAFSR